MTDRFIFRRNTSGKFDLSEEALRNVVGDHKIVMGQSVHWPLADACEREFLEAVKELKFNTPERDYEDCQRHLIAKRPILFQLSRIQRVERDDTTAMFQVAGDGGS